MTVSDFETLIIKSCSIEAKKGSKLKKESDAWNEIQFKDL